MCICIFNVLENLQEMPENGVLHCPPLSCQSAATEKSVVSHGNFRTRNLSPGWSLRHWPMPLPGWKQGLNGHKWPWSFTMVSMQACGTHLAVLGLVGFSDVISASVLGRCWEREGLWLPGMFRLLFRCPSVMGFEYRKLSFEKRMEMLRAWGPQGFPQLVPTWEKPS